MCFAEKNFPIILTASDISDILKISKPTAYEIMKQPNFPLIQIGRSKRVRRDEFFLWLSNTENCIGTFVMDDTQEFQE
ncbi:helix-turn-helix domain-containing protein [Robertmurraya siralis]|uniref:helix-turn-helix domain-containing protein n=1 Tax=Robertmurraya siralis TaxID=77777 RepID=UPI000BA6EA86|nr:helix-turn-helix domain-containing protein [Robertmurraya siralis]PAE18294.1 hypothetical protein CHH80_22435 [Bacillus sp. 7504-2]